MLCKYLFKKINSLFVLNCLEFISNLKLCDVWNIKAVRPIHNLTIDDYKFLLFPSISDNEYHLQKRVWNCLTISVPNRKIEGIHSQGSSSANAALYV